MAHSEGVAVRGFIERMPRQMIPRVGLVVRQGVWPRARVRRGPPVRPPRILLDRPRPSPIRRVGPPATHHVLTRLPEQFGLSLCDRRLYSYHRPGAAERRSIDRLYDGTGCR